MLSQAGAQMLYSAMFDEVDEGTALFKVLPRHQDLPQGTTLLALDADGCSLESDYYLKMAGRISGKFTMQAAKDSPSRGQCFADPLQLWLVVNQILEPSSA